MRIGNNVYCIKDLYYEDYRGKFLVHKKNKTYKILNINNNDYYYPMIFIEIEKNVLKYFDISQGFILNENVNYNSSNGKPIFVLQKNWHLKFNAYFLTEQQYRKLKLQKLNDI